MKCDTCLVDKRVSGSKEPACCKWFMNNVVCGDGSVDNCTDYEPMEVENEREDSEHTEQG